MVSTPAAVLPCLAPTQASSPTMSMVAKETIGSMVALSRITSKVMPATISSSEAEGMTLDWVQVRCRMKMN